VSGVLTLAVYGEGVNGDPGNPFPDTGVPAYEEYGDRDSPPSITHPEPCLTIFPEVFLDLKSVPPHFDLSPTLTPEDSAATIPLA